jgi:sigma-B regulation protein RsbU (phosphoserine phosphatase)
MTDGDRHRNGSAGKKKKIHKTILDDIRREDFRGTLSQDFKEIYRFYLDKETRARLSAMNRFKRWFLIFFWLFKSMIYKMVPVRRVLLVIGLVFILFKMEFGTGSTNVIINTSFIGSMMILLVLMLELKDKLLAKDELEAGRAVQSALIPAENPELPGWGIWLYTRPANEVGGDLVDYMELREGRLGLVLGDVAGKGLGAALFMAKLQATVRALAPNSKSMANLGAKINEIFCRDGLPERFVSMVYCEIRSDSGSVKVLNAGHLPPLILGDESTVKEMEQGGTALGLIPKAKYHGQEIKLKPGDLMIVYSDGVTEAQNSYGEFFGESRLNQLIPGLKNLGVEEAGSHLLGVVDDFIGNTRHSDDLSIILLKRLS